MPRSSLVRDSLALALSQYLARAVLLARGLVAAIALGPALFGSWNALSLVLDYGAYAGGGALQGLDLKLPAALGRGDGAESRRLLSGAAGVVAAGGIGLALVVLALVMRGTRALVEPWGWGAPALTVAAAWVQLAIQYYGSALRARGEFRAVSAAQAAQAGVGGGLGIALVVRFGVWGLLGGWLAGGAAGLLVLARAAAGTPLAPRHPRVGLELAGAGLPIFGFFAVSLVLRSVDRLALVRFGSAADLGRYSVGLMAAALVLYLPEAAAAVLYPRIAAAAGGARDPERTRGEVMRAQRALVALLPLAVAAAMVWVEPVVARWLPAYLGSVEAVRLLAFGALLLAVGTVPGYWMLGRGRSWALLGAGGACAAFAAALVFSVAARIPEPRAVALAAAAGYALFAAVLVGMAAPTLASAQGPAAPAWAVSVRFVAESFLPALWAGAVAFAACRIGAPGSGAAALARTLAVVALYAPVLWWATRGLELGAALRALAPGRTGA